MNAKFTPGPWHIRDHTNVMDSDGRSIAACGGYQSNVDPDKVFERNCANTTLIAAVLEMYELIDDWLAHRGLHERTPFVNQRCDQCQEYDDAFKAILAKARGGE